MIKGWDLCIAYNQFLNIYSLSDLKQHFSLPHCNEIPVLPIARYARSTKPHVYAHGHSISQPILLVGDHVEGAERPGRNDIEIMHSVSAQERSRIISGYH